jgi:hypothetical protein
MVNTGCMPVFPLPPPVGSKSAPCSLCSFSCAAAPHLGQHVDIHGPWPLCILLHPQQVGNQSSEPITLISCWVGMRLKKQVHSWSGRQALECSTRAQPTGIARRQCSPVGLQLPCSRWPTATLQHRLIVHLTASIGRAAAAGGRAPVASRPMLPSQTRCLLPVCP